MKLSVTKRIELIKGIRMWLKVSKEYPNQVGELVLPEDVVNSFRHSPLGAETIALGNGVVILYCKMDAHQYLIKHYGWLTTERFDWQTTNELLHDELVRHPDVIELMNAPSVPT